jgi:hypothetical protein
MKLQLSFALCAILGVAPLGAQTMSPYSGQQARSIKALSADEIRGYLTGEGIGMAKAGELNHYPGPKHILAMSDRLMLTDVQQRRVRTIEIKMTADAVPLGREIVRDEAALDERFAQRTIDTPTLRRMTERIALLQGRLRAVHLAAHLAARSVLSDEQVGIYDRMRGYDGGSSEMNASEHHHG